MPQAGRALCVKDTHKRCFRGCRRADGLFDLADVAVSADGAFLYVAAGYTVTVLRRDANRGGLHPLSVTACIANRRRIPGSIVGLRFAWAEDLYVPRDPRQLYVALGDGIAGLVQSR